MSDSDTTSIDFSVDERRPFRSLRKAAVCVWHLPTFLQMLRRRPESPSASLVQDEYSSRKVPYNCQFCDGNAMLQEKPTSFDLTKFYADGGTFFLLMK